MTTAAPRIFMLPGIRGDEPPLASFRAQLAGRIGCELLDYPDVDRPSREIKDFAGIVSRTVQQINAKQPSGEVYLAGYSFGGQVAFATACRLRKEGRRVGLLALIDSRALSLKTPGADARVRNRDESTGALLAMADAATRLLVAAGLSESVRASIGPVRNILGNDAAEALRGLLLQNLRGRALVDVVHGHFDGPLLLFRAKEQLVADLPSDLGWGPHCSKVFAVELRGGHNSIFRSDHVAGNAELIWSELNRRISGDN